MKKRKTKLSSKKKLKKKVSEETLSFIERKKPSKPNDVSAETLAKIPVSVSVQDQDKEEMEVKETPESFEERKEPSKIKEEAAEKNFKKRVKPKKKAKIGVTPPATTPEIYKPNIKVVGIGGAGVRIVSEMAKVRPMPGVEFIVIDTDRQSLRRSGEARSITIGQSITKGLGTGMNAQLGIEATESDKDKIQAAISGADMVFILSGLGGGTGSGAFPIIAEIAKRTGALVTGMTTIPFSFEGNERKRIAEKALEELEPNVNTLIVISNDKIWQEIERKTPLKRAFGAIDKTLRQGIQGIVDLIVTPGLINVDFADIKAVMEEGGRTLIGIGYSRGENRAEEAAFSAINSPLLDLSIEGAKGILFSIAGGEDLKMLEVNEAAKIITKDVDPEAKIIFGAVKDKNLEGRIRITLIATGLRETGEKSLEEDFDRKSTSLDKDRSEYDEKESLLEIPAFIRRKFKSEDE